MYDYTSDYFDIKKILTTNETLIWHIKPKKSAFIINKVIHMLPIALIWIAFDIPFLSIFLSTGSFNSLNFFIIPFLFFI